jgi:hypothetical protein
VGANINDGDLTSRVDTWNNAGTDHLSFVGILWDQPQTNPVLRLQLTLATFFDGGWFGPNNRGPGDGRPLTPTFLTEPSVQVTTNGGSTWDEVGHASDYLTALNGHGIGGGTNPNPSTVTATFTLTDPKAGINGIRIIGSEGGTASGGFLGVWELAVYAKTDADNDGMDDDWERQHGLVAGVNDAALDPDTDRLSNLQEFLAGTDPKKADTDGDGLKDGDEVDVHHTNPGSSDTDGDGLNDAAEVNVHHTNPSVGDTDADGFTDGQEVQLGSDPTVAGSIPANLAFRGDAAAILGTEDVLGGVDTPVANAGAAANINDGDLTTRVDTWNGDSLDTLSFVGIVWTNPVATPIASLRLSLATFFDGGWFGVNSAGPGAGGLLSTNEYLVEPIVQASADGGLTWTNVAFVSDYMTSLEGHALPAEAFGSPTLAAANFQFNPPVTGISGIRLLGTEGGMASGGFLGVFELAALRSGAEIQVLRLENATSSGGQFRFEFDSRVGVKHVVQFKGDVSDATWQTRSTLVGDGTRKQFSEALSGLHGFYRVMNE